MTDHQFEHLFKTYYTLLYRVAYDMLHDADESHDAVHEVYANLWKRKTDIRPETERELLLRMVHNHCLNVIGQKERDEKLRRTYPLEMKQTLSASPDEDRLQQIHQYIDNEMPPDTRRVLKLCFEEEKSYKEAASIVQYSVAYVNKHIVKALKLLREKFNPSTHKNACLILMVGLAIAVAAPMIREFFAPPSSASVELAEKQPAHDDTAVTTPEGIVADEAATFIFHDVALGEVLQTLADHYGATIDCRDDEAMQMRLYVQIEKSLSLHEVIAFLNHFENIHLSLDGNTIVIGS